MELPPVKNSTVCLFDFEEDINSSFKINHKSLILYEFNLL